MKCRALLGLVLAGLAASGCGLKGPLYLPEKSEVTIRPAPAATPPATPSATPAEPAAPDKEQSAPEQPAKPEQPPQTPPTGTGRG